MLTEVTGKCQRCAAAVTVLMLNEKPLDECSACGKPALSARRIKGLIYVVWNKNQNGVKIGLTTKSIEARIKSLNSTGVPGEFVPVAIFPSERPKADERRVHDQLRKHNIAKEHFDLSPVEAVRKTYTALRKRRPIFFDPETETTFRLRLEELRIKMQLKLRGERSA